MTGFFFIFETGGSSVRVILRQIDSFVRREATSLCSRSRSGGAGHFEYRTSFNGQRTKKL